MTPQELWRMALRAFYPREKMQTPKRQTMYCYTEGPMMYLGQQVVKLMQDSGFPAKIHCCYRSADDQGKLYNQVPKVTKALPYDSAHQYYEAVDIIHPSLGWNVSEAYWTTLSKCWEIIEDKHNLDLSIGHYWNFRDSAHVQLKSWHDFKDKVGAHKPTEDQLNERFREVLPKVWAAR